MSNEDLYKLYLAYPNVQTDTRKLKQGDIFFALSGPNFNGNFFAHKALELGAVYCICDDTSIEPHPQFIFVEDVLICLQELALHHRQQFKIPFIGITGSNGKTTTKELIHVVLNKKYKCYTTEGNLNNHIGVPLTLLKVKQDAEIAIVEMGANHMGEIGSYCKYALPDYGLITNCGKAHLEGFGSEENIKIGKGELFDSVKESNGVLFINEDLDYLQSMLQGYENIINYQPNAYKSPNSDTEMLEFRLVDNDVERLVKTQLVGEYNLPNAIAAVCIGNYFGVETSDIIKALEAYTPSNSRSQLMWYNENKIVLDAYNANPSSMKLAIENFGKINSEEKIIYLGSMKEMGEHSSDEHKLLVTHLESYNWKEVVLVGEEFSGVNHNFTYFKTTAEAQPYFQSKNYNNEQILIKGSRGLALEKLLS
jgi:UDP-N-acetylmuramoyl-tripeptide--D-alanyl-D-alanine ligase